MDIEFVKKIESLSEFKKLSDNEEQFSFSYNSGDSIFNYDDMLGK